MIASYQINKFLYIASDITLELPAFGQLITLLLVGKGELDFVFLQCNSFFYKM